MRALAIPLSPILRPYGASQHLGLHLVEILFCFVRYELLTNGEIEKDVLVGR